MEYIRQEKTHSSFNIEGIIGGHMAHMAMYRDHNPRQYASSIETLIVFCPSEVRKLAREKMKELGIRSCEYTNLSSDQIRKRDALTEYINSLLEERNMIYKASYIKTYE